MNIMDDHSSDFIDTTKNENETLQIHKEENICEPHNLSTDSAHLLGHLVSGEDDPISFRRTEKSLSEFEVHLNQLVNIKKQLSEQFAEEKNALNVNYGKIILGIRNKHRICENNFKKELQSVKDNCKRLEEKGSEDQVKLKSLREQLDLYASENEKIKRQAEDTKLQLETDLKEKEKLIWELKGEKTRLNSRLKLIEEEHKNRKQEFDDKLRQYQVNQDEDSLKIVHLKEELDTTNQEILRLQNGFEDLTEQYKQTEKNNLKLREESSKIKEQLKIEEIAKQEKIEVIHSLTTTLNENRAEIERLRKNFADLESTRRSEVKELQSELSNKETRHELQIRELNDSKFQIETQLKEEITELKDSLRKYKKDCDTQKLTLEQRNDEFQAYKQQNERKVHKLSLEKNSLADKVTRLEDQIVDFNGKLTELNASYDSSQREVNKVKLLLSTAESERDKRKDELIHAHEELRELEMNNSLVRSELEETKQYFEAEKACNKEKSNQITELKDSLLTSHSEIDQLTNENEKLQRSYRDQEDLLRSLEKDRDDLKNILMESEKSRIEVKTKFNNSKYSCLAIENKLKLKEDEVNNLNRRIETLNQERKLLFDELESAGKSLTQMKQLNEKLHEQTLSLQKKNSTLESKKMESDQKFSNSMYSDKDIEIRRVKRDNEIMKDRVSRMENEKRRLERSYANLEKEYSNLKSSTRPNTSLPKRTTSSHVNATRYPSDQSSILSLTRLLSDTNFGAANNSKLDVFSDEAMKVTKGIEALEQQHLEIQQKVLGLENLIDAASSESDLNTTKRSEDFADVKLAEIGSSKSANLETVDYNGNYNDVDEKLKMAQLKAQTLIESSSLFEKEMFKSNRSRSHLLQHDEFESEHELDK